MPVDRIQPFLFEHLDLRGAVVVLEDTWQGLTRNRRYPAPVARLLGEMSAVAALIAANLKQPGRLTLQLRGEGPVSLLVLDCDEQLRLKGMARWNEPVADTTAPVLLGHGHLLLNLDAAGMRQPYQSMVPLQGDRIAEIFEHYLSQSEQTPTRLILAASEHRAAGLFLQKLPNADARDADGWNRIQILAGTLRQEELLTLTPAALLARLFPEDDLRVFDPRPVTHHCPEDHDKIHAMLRSLGRAECEAILHDKGEVHVRDDLCNRDYRFDAAAIQALFEAAARFH
ncbi:MAG: Hsp33 family molecular chaperone HslO [Betaproteobacteria bacterium]|nr:Hsp33 family molecular chaperone HslO [Betaproteobacteria bacterium]